MSSSPHISDSSLPDALAEFRFQAPQTRKGGLRQLLSLVRRPPLAIPETEESKRTAASWDSWWNETAWSRDLTTNDPRWGSSCRSSNIWTQFGEAASLSDGHPHLYCLHCGLALQHPVVQNCGTKHLFNHLKSQSCLQITSSIHSRPQASSPIRRQQRKQDENTPTYSTVAFGQELVRLVIDNDISFRTIERPSFHRFVRFLRPETVLISRYNFGQLFQAQFDAAAARLLQDLGQATKLSLAFDGWTAGNHLGFLAVKGYYVNDNWQLREVLLDFVPLRGRHSGVSLASTILQVLRSTRTTKRLLAITCDNASNNATLSTTLETLLEDEGVRWSSKENRLPCLAHIINLVVQDIISHLQLSSTLQDEQGATLQRQHVRQIETVMSVPNSLRKVCTR
jgi:hypothetical protein